MLTANATKTEQMGRVAPETIEALSTAGVFRMPVPTRYGGRQADLGEQVRALSEIARGCGSAAWCTTIYFTGAWAVSLFPAEVADEVFATPASRVSIVSSPTGALTPHGDDYRLTGKWAFNTGIHDATWDLLGARADGRQVLVLVPKGDLTVHDDWHTSGLKGTGSCTVSVADLLVPRQRVLPFPDLRWSRPPSHPSAADDFFHYELYPLLSAYNSGPPVGLAQAAEDFFTQHVDGRGITFTRYTAQRTAAITHHQAGEVRMKILAATALRDRLVTAVAGAAKRRTAHTLTERAEARALAAYSTRLSHEAVEIVQKASGASSIRQDVPIQRIGRDSLAMSLHAALNADSALEVHGRVLLGLDPETVFL
ncbi:acyl-CoA dehydrogenase family protein [Actinoplanes awajinensis]|uniref:acyl-CoA dehydrogenase family protein n=1 Tax=Actinoplanes awajinensis TaxID=135946 RepID=UPI001E3790DC|nr:acyl-CoA dehydrogenase family protein [Actinoplanes awajinensis]